MSATDGHGTYMAGRNSLVLLGNKQYGNYVNQKNVSAALSATSKKRKYKISAETLNPQLLKKKVIGTRPHHRL